MPVWMQPIKCGYSKVGAEPHGVEDIKGTRCYGCACLSCMRQRSALEPWRYYCDASRKRIDPRNLAMRDCPIASAEARGRPSSGRSAAVADPWAHGKVERTCPVCSETFVARAPKHVYCCAACRAKAAGAAVPAMERAESREREVAGHGD